MLGIFLASLLAAPPGPGGPGVSLGIPIVHMTILPGESASAPARLFAETLPRNTAFLVELPASTLTQSGLLHVWPSTEEPPDCKGSGGRQAYCLPMLLEVTQGRPVLRTVVPQLQSGIQFKFIVVQYDSLAPDVAGSLAGGVADRILADLEPVPAPALASCDPHGRATTRGATPLPKISVSTSDVAVRGLTEALVDASSRDSLEAKLRPLMAGEMARRGISGDPSAAARIAIDDFVATHEHAALMRKIDDLKTKSVALESAHTRVCDIYRRAYEKASAKVGSPTVHLDGKLVPIANFFDRRNSALLSDASLSGAITQLAQWKNEVGGPTPHPSDPWRAALQSLLDLDPQQRPAAAQAIDRSGFPSSIPAVVWDPQKNRLVLLTTAVDSYETLKPEHTGAQVESIRSSFLDDQQPLVFDLLNLLRRLSEARETRNKARADLDAALAARDQAFPAARDALRRAINSPTATSALSTLRRSEGLSDPKLLRTPSAGSFASPDVGAFVAAPVVWRKGSGDARMPGDEPWVMPYFGMNLYLEPVERDLPLDQVVESRSGRFFNRQRWSGTVGFVFKTEPKLPARRVEPMFLSAYPVLGIGYRVTPYLRVTGGGVGYWLLDANPASARRSFAVAPFVGVSLDTDLVSLMMNQFKR